MRTQMISPVIFALGWLAGRREFGKRSNERRLVTSHLASIPVYPNAIPGRLRPDGSRFGGIVSIVANQRGETGIFNE